MNPNPQLVSRANVGEFRQNKPSYICRDLEEFGVSRDKTARILMARGVTKWLAVRRDLIRLKDRWKREIRTIHTQLPTLRGGERARLQGRLGALENCRAEVRALCHSSRWRCPDHDGKFWAYLGEKMGDGGLG